MTGGPKQHRSAAFMLAYALANTGGVLAYLPFLTLLLPLKVEALVGDTRVAVLSIILIGGAVAASIGNILVGMVIDRSYARGGGRRGWIVLGAVVLGAGYALVLAAHTPLMLFVAVVMFQLALNVMLSPIGAVMVDEVPDGQKGLAGGLLAFAQPMAMMAAVALVSLYEWGEGAAYLAVSLGVVVLVLPLLLAGARPVVMLEGEAQATMSRGDLVWVGVSRLMLMTANSILAGVLVYYFESLSWAVTAGTVARRVGVVSMLANAAAVPVAVLIGALPADGRRRKLFVMAAALMAGGALGLMLMTRSWQLAALGYGLFVCALQVYASQHSAIVAQALRRPDHRARDLGLQNLANTIPAVIGPMIILLLHASADLHALIWAMLLLVGGCVLTLAKVRIR
jgi:MFS family permease